MTDRVRTLVVILEDDQRAGAGEWTEDLRKAISMMNGVAKVEYGDVVTGSDHIHRETLRMEFERELMEFVRNWRKKRSAG